MCLLCLNFWTKGLGALVSIKTHTQTNDVPFVKFLKGHEKRSSWGIQKAKDESCEYLPCVSFKEDMKPHYNNNPMTIHETPTKRENT